MQGTNNYLKGLIVQRYGTQKAFLMALEEGGLSICEARLSRILHRRARPNAAEKRQIAWRLQRSAKELSGRTGRRLRDDP